MTDPTVAPTDTFPGTAAISVGYVDVDPTTGDGIATALERANDRLAVDPVVADEAGLERMATGEFDCLVARIGTTVGDRPILDCVRERRPNRPIFLLTDDREEDAASAALENDATGCLPESAARHGTRLATRIDRAVERTAEAHDWDLAATASESVGARFEITEVSRPQDAR